MLWDTNRLCNPSKWHSAAAIRQGIAANMAAFDGAVVAFVAALRGIFDMNSLPRRRHVLFGLEFSGFRIKEHDA